MLMLFRGWILDFHYKNAEEPNLRRRSPEKLAKKKRLRRVFSRRRARFVSRVSLTKAFPLVSPPQLKKQNDKESARDMTGYKPSNFDKGFREGKGWGDLVRRLGKQ